MAEIIVGMTIIGNTILVLLMLYRGWTARLQWFAMMTALAVLVDCLFYFIHSFAHDLYSPLRMFILYWLFPILELACAWEAALLRMKWLEYLLLIQVAIAATAGFAHLHGDSLAVYRIEIFNTYFNIFGIIYCIFRLKGEPHYEPREAR